MDDQAVFYQPAMREFYSGMEEFISRRPKIQKVVEENAALFKGLDMDEADRQSMFTDWLIFDFRRKTGRRSILEDFLEKGDLSAEQKRLYRGFLNGVFSIFEVKAVRIGKQLLLHDLLTGIEYSVFDTQASAFLAKGQCAILRVLPFQDIFILTGREYSFPPAATAALKLFINVNRQPMVKPGSSPNLTILDVIKLIAEAGGTKEIPADQHFIKLGLEAGARRGDILQTIQEARQSFSAKGSPTQAFADLVKKILLQPQHDEIFSRLQAAFIELWNSWVEESAGHVAKGPVEVSLIRICMGYVAQKVKPEDFPNLAEAEAEANRLQKMWLSEPKTEFDGNTPMETILAERERLGNPETRVEFSVRLTPLEPGAEIEATAEKLFYSGLDHLQGGNPKKAAEVFLEYLELAPWNHVVWHNLGIAHLLMMDVKQAIPCLEKALDLKPDYKLAQKNLRRAQNASFKEIERMAKEYKVVLSAGMRDRVE